MKTLPTPALFGVATAALLRASEKTLGFALPVLLQKVYTEVGNGGFGPGGGLLGLEGGYADSDGRTLLERFQWLRSEGWKEGLLPLFDWGDGAWSCVDAFKSDGTIVTVDESGYTETRFDLVSWFSGWIEGVDLHSEIFETEDAVIINPFTRKPMVVKRRVKAKGKMP
jgi:hypothetical protein